MKPAALTVASTVTCSHGAVAVIATPGTAKLRVAKVCVLLPTDLTAAILTCTGTGSGADKCAGITSAMDGVPTAKLTVGGTPVVRDTLTGLTSGTPPKLTCVAGQSKLTTV